MFRLSLRDVDRQPSSWSAMCSLLAQDFLDGRHFISEAIARGASAVVAGADIGSVPFLLFQYPTSIEHLVMPRAASSVIQAER